MAYVTEDKRVNKLIADRRANRITRETFIEAVKGLGFLDWEVAEAVKKLDGPGT